MVLESTFPILTSSAEFQDLTATAPSIIAFLAFGVVCFTIGTQCSPKLSAGKYITKIRELKDRIAILERRLAQTDGAEEEDGRVQHAPEQEKKLQGTIHAQKRELRAASEKINTLSAQNEQFRAEWQKAKGELSTAKDELRGARAYMSMEDEYSGAEVMKHVERLNAAIMQAAANLAERVGVDTMAGQAVSTLEGPNEEVVRRAEDIVGGHLMKLLRASRNEAVLELAFQTAMALYAQKIASSWCFRNSNDEELLQECYTSMREDKFQGIFGRWRQLTRTHLRASKSAFKARLLPDLAEELVHIVVAGGHGEDPSSLTQMIITSYSDALNEIVDLATELNMMIGEGVTSLDINVVFVKPETVYDPAEMVDADGSTTLGDVGLERVVCTTDLGLVSVKKTVDKMDTFVMLKAKVILPSMLVGIEES